MYHRILPNFTVEMGIVEEKTCELGGWQEQFS